MKYQKKSYGNSRNFKKAWKGGEAPADCHEPVQAQPLEVMVYGNNFDKAFRAFRALVQKERVLSSFKEKQYYEKPSDKKRRKKNESFRKQLELCSKGECTHQEHIQNKR